MRKYTPKDDGYMAYLRKIVRDVYPLCDPGRSKYVTTRAVYRMVEKYWNHPELPFEVVSVASVGFALESLGLKYAMIAYDRTDKIMCRGRASAKQLKSNSGPMP